MTTRTEAGRGLAAGGRDHVRDRDPMSWSQRKALHETGLTSLLLGRGMSPRGRYVAVMAMERPTKLSGEDPLVSRPTTRRSGSLRYRERPAESADMRTAPASHTPNPTTDPSGYPQLRSIDYRVTIAT